MRSMLEHKDDVRDQDCLSDAILRLKEFTCSTWLRCRWCETEAAQHFRRANLDSRRFRGAWHLRSSVTELGTSGDQFLRTRCQ